MYEWSDQTVENMNYAPCSRSVVFLFLVTFWSAHIIQDLYTDTGAVARLSSANEALSTNIGKLNKCRQMSTETDFPLKMHI